MKTLSLFFLLILSSGAFCQGKIYKFDSFSAKIENNILHAFDTNNRDIFVKEFNDPQDFVSDLDGDGINEYLVIDLTKQRTGNFFTLYIFNTIDSFYVADSIPSGYYEPYQTLSKETGGKIIVSGNPKFDSFNSDSGSIYLPINCWKYDNGEIFSVNDEVYNVFIAENDTLIDIIDSFFAETDDTCAASNKMKAAIAAVYANYLTAGDKILAARFLKNYYHCPELEIFRQKIKSLL